MPDPEKTIERADPVGKSSSQNLTPEIEAEIAAAMADIDQAAEAAEAADAAKPNTGGKGRGK
ncbi:MAG: hypothetical protein ACF8LK_08240, partial [Phycisphaerales bacterium JB041]